jgi:hypothetical protein
MQPEVTFPVYPSMKNFAGAPGGERKKTLKTLTIGAQEIKP